MTYRDKDRRLSSALLAVVTLTACPDRATETADTSASSDGSAATDEPITSTTPTTGEPFEGVTVTREDSYVSADGTPTPVSADPLGTLLDMTVLVGEAIFTGEYDGAGHRRFANVPNEPFLLREQYAPSPTLPGTAPYLLFTATDTRELDHGATYSGRPDVTLTTASGTVLSVDVTDMQPLQVEDSFEVYSFEADVQGYYQSTFDPDAPDPGQPAPGATSLDGWKLAWDSSEVATGRDDLPLPDPGKGDRLRLDHLVSAPFIDPDLTASDPWFYATTTRLAETAVLTFPAMTAGATAAASGAFVAAPMKTAQLDLRLSAFFPEIEALADTTDQLNCQVFVYLEPGLAAPIIGMIPTLASLSVDALEFYTDPLCSPDEFDECDPDFCPDGCNDETIFTKPADRVVALTYGNPFEHGTETVSIQCFNRLYVEHPLAKTSESLFSRVSVGRRLTDTDPIVPTISAPRNPRIAGQPAPASSVTTEVGLTPTFGFDPPTLGNPDYYVVQIRTIDNVVDGDEILSSRRTVATLRTTATSMQIPAGVLVPGAFYTIEVIARSGVALTAPARPLTHDLADASTSSGIFSP